MKRRRAPKSATVWIATTAAFLWSAAEALPNGSGEASELLASTVEEGHAILWHLYHSGFAVKTSSHLLIFDYWPGGKRRRDGQGLADGFIDPEQIEDENVVVFVSHEHRDHWFGGAIEWSGEIERIRYVVSPEVSRRDDRFADGGTVTTLGPNQTSRLEDMSISTLESTDSGVAFLVKTDGLTLYHSGDHAAWNWDGDPGANDYFVRTLLKPLRQERIDIAMHVCDPRLRAGGWGGILAFARELKPRLLVPMHFRGDYSVGRQVGSILQEREIPVAFWPIRARGDHIVFPPEEARDE